jgi:hypothetical protein
MINKETLAFEGDCGALDCEAKFIGSPSFGAGRIRFTINGESTYTIWMICLTRKLAMGIHIGGSRKHAR